MILKVDGTENPTWRDLKEAVLVSPNQALAVTVKRGNELKQVNLQVGARPTDNGDEGYAGLDPDPGPNARLVVLGVVEGQPAAEAGIKAEDQIVAINGKAAGQNYGGVSELMRAISSNDGKPVQLRIQRGSEVIDLNAQPSMQEGRWRLGFYPGLVDREIVSTRLGPWQALVHAVDQNKRIMQLTFKALGQVFSGQRKASETVAGPIQIARFAGEAASQGAASVFSLMAFLSLNLGVFNLLPIPVLDGGMIFMLLLESILGLFGLPLTLRIKERMMQVGIVMLFLLMGFVIFNDVSKLMPGTSSKPAQTQQQTEPDK